MKRKKLKKPMTVSQVLKWLNSDQKILHRMVELMIDDENPKHGVNAIGLVDRPAIQSNFTYHKKKVAKVKPEQETFSEARFTPKKKNRWQPKNKLKFKTQ